MSEENKANAPVQKFNAGSIQASVWANKDKEGKNEFLTISVERSYLVKENNEDVWKKTSSLRVRDIPDVQLVLEKCYEYAKMQHKKVQE